MSQDQKISDEFFGHPIGLRTLFLTEMWERMSFYGMRGLLVLFMTREITDGGMNLSAPEAMAIYGIYGASVYFLCVPGGWVADKIFGAQRTVLYGAIVITLGHYVLAIPSDKTFFLGLVLVSIGTGLLKPNISTIVGELYKPGDLRIDSGYTIFYMSINIGSMLGFLVCGYLGEKVGWHWGFGAAGIGMLFGVIQYYYFRGLLGNAGIKPNDMPDEQRQVYIKWSRVTIALMGAVIVAGLLGFISVDPRAFAEYFLYFLGVVAAIYFAYLLLLAGLSSQEKKNVFLLMILFVAAMFFWSGFDQSGGSLSIFARDYTDLSVVGYVIPVGWLQFANPLFVVIFAPIFAGIWTNLARVNLNPSYPLKFAIGMFFMAISFLVMIAAVELALVSAPVGMQWLIITYLLHTWGELALSPVGLAAFSEYSPKKYQGQMFGLWFLASALGGVLAGLLGGDALVEGLESMTPVFDSMIQFYVVAGIVLVLFASVSYYLRSRNN